MFLYSNRFYLLFITVWILGLYFLRTIYLLPSSDHQADQRIQTLQKEVESLQAKLRQIQPENGKASCEGLQEEIARLKRQLSEKAGGATNQQRGPALEYEQLRRKIESQTRELSYFTNSQMRQLTEKFSEDEKSKWSRVIERFNDQYRVLLASVRNLTSVDGYQSWREREHATLSQLMQARLNSLQNPSKACTDVKRISCNLNKGCGYGCEIHHAMHCFHTAYALGRPMYLVSHGWRYNPGGFEQIFQPLSNNCTREMFSGPASWGNYETADVVEVPLIDGIHPRADFLPMSVPADLAERLIRLHGNPFVWFTGQLMKYLLRPQDWLKEFLEKKYTDIQFQTPIVGIHVRRTDKVGTEAAFHDISEYMKYVEDYYRTFQYQNPNLSFVKRVYLATDEPTVFQDARSKYPDYTFYGDAGVAESAQLHTRYGTESLKGVLLDIHFLSLTDYLVCTFSSQICRVAYEIMQQRVIDGAWRVQPLDDVYYFGGQSAHNQRAVVSHKALWRGEFSFERGDLIGTEGNHWDGFSKGSDKTNQKSGLYPSYKVEEIVNIAKMYTYPEIEMSENAV